jgi:hypothetical protein
MNQIRLITYHIISGDGEVTIVKNVDADKFIDLRTKYNFLIHIHRSKEQKDARLALALSCRVI